MNDVNSPEVAGWVLVAALLVCAILFTVSLIRDNREHKAHMRRQREYRRRDVALTNMLFKNVEEARNDFR